MRTKEDLGVIARALQLKISQYERQILWCILKGRGDEMPLEDVVDRSSFLTVNEI